MRPLVSVKEKMKSDDETVVSSPTLRYTINHNMIILLPPSPGIDDRRSIILFCSMLNKCFLLWTSDATIKKTPHTKIRSRRKKWMRSILSFPACFEVVYVIPLTLQFWLWFQLFGHVQISLTNNNKKLHWCHYQLTGWWTLLCTQCTHLHILLVNASIHHLSVVVVMMIIITSRQPVTTSLVPSFYSFSSGITDCTESGITSRNVFNLLWKKLVGWLMPKLFY